MRSIRFRHAAMALLVSFGVMACSDDDSPTATGDLDPGQVEVMMEALVIAGGFGLVGFGFSAADDGMAVQNVPIDEVIGCPGGGTVTTTGQVSFNEATGNISFSTTQTHDSCVVTAPSDGSTWTFDGAPSVSMSLSGNVSGSGDSFSFEGSQGGGIAFSSGGNSGVCQINVQTSIAFSGDSGTVNQSGTLCGIDVSFSGPLT